MIQTSYFGQAGLLWTDPRVCAISLTVPRGYHGRRYPALAPSRELLTEWKKGYLTWDQYARMYQTEVLDRLDPMDVASDLGDGAIMLCWEKWVPDLKCHRSLVAAWLDFIEPVPEWEVECG